MFSTMPTMSPPTTAPGMESSPPRITTGNTLNPTRARFTSTPSRFPHMMPPRADTTPVIAQARPKYRSTSMPMAMGIDVERYFGLAWAMTGVVSALGGIMWGNLLGVDVNLALVGFKVFPVVILGGLDSIPGAIVGGLIVGIVENVAAGYVDPYVGGGTKDFAPYVLMILALMVRPYGIFGKRIIERV